MIKAVFFDLGDTLCDYEGAAGVAIDSACEYAVGHAQGLTAGGLREAYLRELRHAEGDALRWTASRPGRTGPQEGFRPWERALEKCGIANPILAHAVALHYELSRVRALAPLPDALPAVQALQGRVRVGLIAEGSPGTVNEELTLLGLRGLLSSVLIDEQVGYSKRDPQLFSHAVREAGCEPAQAAHVGDSLEADVAPAHAAGLVTVWVNRAGAEPRPDLAAPDHIVSDLQPVAELLLGKA
jgi:HAD superfamily hydrolase (TIGR01509 family)